MADDGKVIRFDKAAYDDLIRFVDGATADLESKFIKPRAGIRLDSYLKDEVKPGADTWPPAGNIKTSAGSFGDSVYTRLKGLKDDWKQFLHGLNSAEDVFQKHDDLAAMSAQDFLEEHPDFNGGSSF